MKEEKVAHTPSPWEVSDTSIVAGQYCIAVIETDGGYEAPAEERDANAHLIAASPDLFEAATLQEAAENHWANCEDCEGSASPELGCEIGFKMADDARCIRRAAIAKAKGEIPRTGEGNG